MLTTFCVVMLVAGAVVQVLTAKMDADDCFDEQE